jgi:PDZ domain-containing secreted protein
MLKIIMEIVVALLVSAASFWAGQQAFGATEGKPQMRMFSSGDIVFLNELGAIIMPRDSAFVVDMVNQPDQRSKEYKSVDLRKDDIIIMINGKKAKALADLQTVYDSLAVGQDVKLGVMRGKDRMIISFVKADASKLPNRQVMAFSTEGNGDSVVTETIHGDGVKGKKVMRFGPGEGNIAMVTELGLILNEADAKIKIVGIQNDAPASVKSSGVQTDDAVTMIDKSKVGSMKEFLAVYDKIKSGTEFTLAIDRGGKTVEVKGIKEDQSNQPQIIRTIKK